MSQSVARYDIAAAARVLQRAADLLGKNDWFLRDWLYSVHAFPPAPAPGESMTLHVFRPGWFNDDKKGIHFETFLGPKEWKKRQLPIMMHIFHCTHIPGTSIKRKQVSQPFVDAVFERVSRWDGYIFRAGRYGTQPFTGMLNVEFETADQALADALAQLCLELGPTMDETLVSLLGDCVAR